FVEQALFLEPLFQLLESQLKSAQADRLHVADVDLILAARFVNAERSAHGDVQTVLGPEFQPAKLIAKTNAANLRARVLQSEIEMARLRGVIVRDFALHPNVGEISLQQIADALREFAYFPDAPLRHQVEEGGLAHFGHRDYRRNRFTIQKNSVKTALRRRQV